MKTFDKIAGMICPENYTKRAPDVNSIEWFLKLDNAAEEYLSRWSLTGDRIAEIGNMSCCIFCFDENGSEFVLKLPTTVESGRLEIMALEEWKNSSATPKIFKKDVATGVFVMTKLPGEILKPSRNLKDIENFVNLWENLQVESSGSLPELQTNIDLREIWAESIRIRDNVTGRTRKLQKAESRAKELLSVRANNIIHGDLQLHNILKDGNTLYAIDPIATVGDPLFDVAMWIIAQDSPISISVMAKVISEMTEIDKSRLIEWCEVLAEIDFNPARVKITERYEKFLDG